MLRAQQRQQHRRHLMRIVARALLSLTGLCATAAAQVAPVSDPLGRSSEAAVPPDQVWQVPLGAALLDGAHRSVVLRELHIQAVSGSHERLAVEAAEQQVPRNFRSAVSLDSPEIVKGKSDLPALEQAAAPLFALMLAPADTPVGTPDRYAVANDRTLSIAAPGFLANDIDLNGEALTAVSIQDGVDHGVLAAFADGSFTYTPTADFVGTDSFAYRMRDASNNFSDPVAVTIDVLPRANRTPLGTPDAYAVLAGATLSIAAQGFLANDIDQDGEAITAVSIQDNVDSGTLAAFADGSFTYTPNAGFTGSDSFAYRMRDASNNFSDPVPVTIEVHAGNRAPIGVDDAYGARINTPLSIAAPGFLVNDLDPDGEAITAVSIQDNVDHGTLAAFANGSFTYTPNAGFTGADSFAYRMRDASNNLSDPITVSIQVFPAGVTPVGTPDQYQVHTDDVLSLPAPGFLANDIDLNGEALTAVSIQDNVDQGTLAAFADGSFTYTPNAGFTGADSFAYRMRDASNNFSDPVLVTITVLAAANRTPLGTPDAYALLADTTLTVPARGFLTNDIDLDGEVITAVSIQDNVDHGTLAAFADGSFTYTPDAGFTGTDSFAYRMRDASNHFSAPVTVTLEVHAGNRAPIGVPDAYSVLMDTALSIAAPGFLANDFDLDGEAVTAVSIQDNVDHGSLAAFADGSFTYTPTAGFSGTDSFAYRMRDASNHFSDPIAVTINVVDPHHVCAAHNLAARAKGAKVQLTWTPTGADHYNVYRSTTSGGPYVKIAATASSYSTYLDAGVTIGTTYYYVVRDADAFDQEGCESNEATATPASR
jgi:hypothetical protein